MWYKTIGTVILIAGVIFLSGCGGDGGKKKNNDDDNTTITNHPPAAHDDTASAIRGGAAVTIDVLANDTDEDDDTLKLKLGSVTNPNHGGTVSVSGNTITYTPPEDYSGMETFYYTVTDGQGGEKTATVTVTIARKWDIAKQIGDDAVSPRIASDGKGNIMAVWSQLDGTDEYIVANRYTIESGWGTAIQIGEKSSISYFPKIAIDGLGNAMAVWSERDSTAHQSIYANYYTAGIGWGIETLIETDNSDNALYPQIAFDGEGNAIAVWTMANGSHNHIWTNRYVAGTGWGTTILLKAGSTNPHLFYSAPQIALDKEGNGIAVWSQWDGAHQNIYAKRYSAGIGWGATMAIETKNGEAKFPQIAFDTEGNALAVWNQTNGTSDSIYAKRYSAGSGWGATMAIETKNGEAKFPQIAFDTEGNALAVWQQKDGSHYSIYANRYTAADDTWGTAELIETGSGNAKFPKIAFDTEGNAIAVWEQGDGTFVSIYANHYRAKEGWGKATLIETSSGNSKSPHITFDGKGNAMVVWVHSNYNNGTSVWFNRFW